MDILTSLVSFLLAVTSTGAAVTVDTFKKVFVDTNSWNSMASANFPAPYIYTKR